MSGRWGEGGETQRKEIMRADLGGKVVRQPSAIWAEWLLGCWIQEKQR